jgi:hypothetical protein
MTHAIVGGALIQSSFGKAARDFKSRRRGNFEAVVFLQGEKKLIHYWQDTSRIDTWWQQGRRRPGIEIDIATWAVRAVSKQATISEHATGAGSIIQSNFGSRGNFEVVVPEPNGLAHYWHDNSDVSLPWSRSTTVAPGSTGPGSIVQNRKNNNLEVVVLHGQELRHYRRDGSGWRPSLDRPITTRASGPACLIQSTWNNLEVVVLEGSNLVHYWREESEPTAMKWKFGGIITDRATGPAGFSQGSYGNESNPNFEVVVPEGDVLAHYWRDNTDGDQPWYRGGTVTRGAGPVNAAALVESFFQTDQPDAPRQVFEANLEVLSQENGGSLYHYYRYWDRQTSRVRWYRGRCLRVAELDVADIDRDRPRSTKIAQLTGQWDAERNEDTLNQTEQFGIRGTDLGASFWHGGRIYFLFGDTVRTQPIEEWAWAFDSIASTKQMRASVLRPPGTRVRPLHGFRPLPGLPLQFHRAYPEIVNPPVPQRQYDVPLDGFSFSEQMFVFFSTDHFTNRKVMGRSVLTRCLDANPDFDEPSDIYSPLRFQNLTTFSTLKFINVSVERVRAKAIREYHLPAQTDGLLIWGTGAFRSDNIYLAFLPLDDPRTSGHLFGSSAFPSSQLRRLYFTGERDGVPQWSVWEEDAVPLFYPAAIGELSVRWNAVLGHWVCMYCAGPEDPIGGAAVVLRVSAKPWGPWSRRRLVLDWVKWGLGKFIHNANGPDKVGDNLISDRHGGVPYAPYQLPHHTLRARDKAVLYYVLSTWDPYQVVQMRHDIAWWDLRFLMLGTRPLRNLPTKRGVRLGQRRRRRRPR